MEYLLPEMTIGEWGNVYGMGCLFKNFVITSGYPLQRKYNY
ncbi:hypothetical protein [Tenacibaculum xiamenense]